MASVLYIFYGKDSFSLREALTDLQEGLARESAFPIQVDRLAGAAATPAEVINTCRTAPFLGSHRLVVVEGLLGRFNPPERQPRRPPAPPAELGPWQALVDAIEAMPPSTVLVLVDGELRPENRLLKALSAKAQVRAFPPLALKEIPGWIRERARGQGAAITAEAVGLLADLVGNNLWVLASELEKLAIYSCPTHPSPFGDFPAAGRPITGEDVRALVAASREVGVFALVDAVAEGRRGRALQALKRLRDEGVDGGYLLSMLARQYRLLLLAQEMASQGLSPTAVAQGLGRVEPWLAEKLLRQGRRYPLRRLEEAHRQLLATDVAIKRGLRNEEVALELLVGELTR